MRPFLIILAVTTIAFVIAVGNVIAFGYYAYATKAAIAAHAPSGRELERMDNALEADVGVIARSSELAVAQVIILVAARRMKRVVHAA